MMSMAINPWQMFLAIGILLITAEVFIPGFVLLPLGIGFLLTAGLAVFVSQWPILLSALAAFEVLMFFVFKKYLKKYQGQTNAYTNAEGMVGKEVSVTERITATNPGYIKLYGDRWLAECRLGETIEAGGRVVIVAIEGNKVIVEPIG